MKKIHQDESGVTLVEVVVSMLLLSIAVLTSLTILATGILANDISRDKGVALNLAEREIEKWKQVPGNSLTEGTLDEYTAKLNGEVANDPSTMNTDSLKVKVTAAQYRDFPGLVQITVEVTRHYADREQSRDVSLIKLAVVRKT